MTKMTPIESEFATTEDEAAYDARRAPGRASLVDPSPPIPHDQVIAELRAIIAARRTKPA